MDLLKTPQKCFQNCVDFPFQEHFLKIKHFHMHYVDQMPQSGPIKDPMVLLHGEPTWGFLYRNMILSLKKKGYRVLAPDFIGFGKSDKCARVQDYTYALHVETLQAWIEKLDLRHITLVCQNWGGLIGLRVAVTCPWRFDRIVAANTGLPTGEKPLSKAFLRWRAWMQQAPDLDVGAIVQKGCVRTLSRSELNAYRAPFPHPRFLAGVRAFPALVPVSSKEPQAQENQKAWKAWMKWEKPFLTLFSDQDPITRGVEKIFQALVPGARNMPHAILKGAGHFLQEDQARVFAEKVDQFFIKTIEV